MQESGQGRSLNYVCLEREGEMARAGRRVSGFNGENRPCNAVGVDSHIRQPEVRFAEA